MGVAYPKDMGAREWPMQGMRGVVAFATKQHEHTGREAAAANETWLAYPDDDPVRTVTSGADSRAALAPLLAHQVGSSVAVCSSSAYVT